MDTSGIVQNYFKFIKILIKSVQFYLPLISNMFPNNIQVVYANQTRFTEDVVKIVHN